MAQKLYQELRPWSHLFDGSGAFSRRVARRVEEGVRTFGEQLTCNDWQTTVEFICKEMGQAIGMPDKAQASAIANLAVSRKTAGVFGSVRPRGHMEPSIVAILLATEVHVRRGLAVSLPPWGRITETQDYGVLRRLASSADDVARIARKALGTHEPWTWNLDEASRCWSLEREEERRLLTRLADDGECAVERFRSDVGALWEPDRTEPNLPAQREQGMWLVVDVEREGIAIARRVHVKERGRVETIDGTVLLDVGSPVGVWLRGKGRDQIPVDPAIWRARFGLLHPARSTRGVR